MEGTAVEWQLFLRNPSAPPVRKMSCGISNARKTASGSGSAKENSLWERSLPDKWIRKKQKPWSSGPTALRASHPRNRHTSSPSLSVLPGSYGTGCSPTGRTVIRKRGSPRRSAPLPPIRRIQTLPG